jgi:hypothetical protein
LLLKAIQYHEKIDHSHFCAFAGRLNAGVLFKRTRDDHNYNASDHCDYAATAAQYPDHNNAYDRLLRGGSCRSEKEDLPNGSSFSFFKRNTIDLTRLPGGRLVAEQPLRFVDRSFRALRLFFFHLTDHRRDGL